MLFRSPQVTSLVAPACLMSGYYLNELLLKLLGREDPHPDVFEFYGATLRQLADPADERRALRIFEKRFLDALGFGIDYAHCLATGDGVLAERYYRVDPQQGVVGETTPAHPAAVPGTDLLALAGESLSSDSQLQVARRLLGSTLEAVLDGRELHSRRVARAVKSRPATTEG